MTQLCRHCGHTSPVGRRFCSQCGQPLPSKCQSCGADLNPESKFCGRCGAALTLPRAAPAQVARPAPPPAAPRPAAPAPAELRVFRCHSADVTCVAASPDGRRALSGDVNGNLSLLDLGSAQQPFRLAGHKAAVTVVAFSPDGRYALSAGGFRDSVIRIWDLAGGRAVRWLEGHDDGVTAAVFSADSTAILSGSDDGTVRLWEAASGFELLRLVGHTKQILAVGLTSDGRRALSAANDMTIRVWDVAADRELSCTRLDPQYADLVYDCAFSQDGSLAVSTDPNGIQVWDLAKGTRLRTLSGHWGNIFSVAFLPDGRRVLSSSGTDYYDDETRRYLGGVDNTVRLWDVQTGLQLARFEGHQGNVNCVACLPDGRHALSGSNDTTVRLWSLPA